MEDNDVIYDGWSFADNGIVLTKINHMIVARRDNQIETRANRNGGVLVQSLLGTKPIPIEGYYIGTGETQEDRIINTQEMYDTLAQIMNRQDRPLIVPHAGSTRQYTATPENVIIEQPDGLNRLTFSFDFVVPSGNADDTSTTTAFSTTVTTASSTIPFTVLGSVVARPLISITFTTVTGGTSKTVSIRNARDFIGLTFSRTFVSGDTITIDSENFQIYVNGVLTAPSGRMPTFAPGTASLSYSDTLTTRNVSISLTYVRKDL